METAELGAGQNPVPDEIEEIEEEVTFVVEYTTKITFPKQYTREEKIEMLKDSFRDFLEHGELVELDF